MYNSIIIIIINNYFQITAPRSFVPHRHVSDQVALDKTTR